MADYSVIQKDYETLVDLLTTLTKAGSAIASDEKIKNAFKSEFIFYAGALSLIDGDIAKEEMSALSEIFDYKFDYSAVMTAARGFSDTMNNIPQCLSVAVQIDNAVADNSTLSKLLSYHVVTLFDSIAKAVVSADKILADPEIKLTVNYINRLTDYMNDNLSESAKAKLPG